MEKAKVIAIANYKGGVGKTTTALAFGRALALNGKNVLLIDGDDSGNPSLTINLGLAGDDEQISLTTLMYERISVKSGLAKASQITSVDKAIFHVDEENLDVLPADEYLPAITANVFRNISDAECPGILKEIIDDILCGYTTKNYDYVIIDAAPALNMMSKNILAAAHEVIIPAQSQGSSADGVTGLISFAMDVKEHINPSLLIRGILVTMLDSRTKYNKEKAIDMTNIYSDMGLKFFDTKIQRGVRAEECIEKHQSIVSYDPNGKVAKAYISFANEYIG
jgi:chromosome partitioning protein